MEGLGFFLMLTLIFLSIFLPSRIESVMVLKHKQQIELKQFELIEQFNNQECARITEKYRTNEE